MTVWCAFSAAGVIGPYFFKNENGQRVTVNGNRYRNMIVNYFYQKIGDTDMVNMWSQQDGVTCHTAAETINLLRTKFGDAIISKNGPVNWPPRSCDLTPLDFFLWGYIKSVVYVNKPDSTESLKANIVHAIDKISPELCEKVSKNWVDRIHFVQRSRGEHLNDIIFKY